MPSGGAWLVLSSPQRLHYNSFKMRNVPKYKCFDISVFTLVGCQRNMLKANFLSQILKVIEKLVSYYSVSHPANLYGHLKAVVIKKQIVLTLEVSSSVRQKRSFTNCL